MTTIYGGPRFTPGRLQALALTAGPLVLPLFAIELVWLHTLIPLVVCYHLVVLGGREGNTVVTWALGAAGLMALISQSLLVFVFGLTMVPLGYILAAGIRRGDAPSWTGLKGLGYLLCLWLLLGAYSGLTDGPSPLQVTLESLEQSMAAALGQLEPAAENGADAPAAPLSDQELAAAYDNLQRFISRAWPALFTISFISLVWLNLVASHWLLRRKDPALTPWPEFKYWRLPEHFVVVAALALVLLLVRLEPLATIGLNGSLIMGMLYFMQGLGIMSALLVYWNVPPLLRGICYALVLMQIYGLLLLALLGMADIRLNFRQRLQKNDSS